MNDKYDSNINSDNENDSDGDLRRLFQQMRHEDAGQAPGFPDVALLAAREPVVAGHAPYLTVPKIAAAAAVAALAILLLREPAPQDPAVLYAEIMSASSIATDTMLSVSPGTLPGMLGMPDVYEPGVTEGAGQGMN